MSPLRLSFWKSLAGRDVGWSGKSARTNSTRIFAGARATPLVCAADAAATGDAAARVALVLDDVPARAELECVAVPACDVRTTNAAHATISTHAASPARHAPRRRTCGRAR